MSSPNNSFVLQVGDKREDFKSLTCYPLLNSALSAPSFILPLASKGVGEGLSFPIIAKFCGGGSQRRTPRLNRASWVRGFTLLRNLITSTQQFGKDSLQPLYSKTSTTSSPAKRENSPTTSSPARRKGFKGEEFFPTVPPQPGGD